MEPVREPGHRTEAEIVKNLEEACARLSAVVREVQQFEEELRRLRRSKIANGAGISNAICSEVPIIGESKNAK